jgi:hypothetical protein
LEHPKSKKKLKASYSNMGCPSLKNERFGQTIIFVWPFHLSTHHALVQANVSTLSH